MINPQTIIEVYGTAIPLSILMIDNDEDRAFAISFYTEHKRLLIYLVKQRIGNYQDAEDVVEESVLHLISKIDTLKSMSEAATNRYIASTVRHTVINYRSKNAKHYQNRVDLTKEQIDEENTGESYEDLDDYLFNRFNVNELLAGFHHLTQTDRDLLMLRHYDNLSIDDIAQLMNMNHQTVSNRLNKAKQRVIREADVQKKTRP